MSEIIQVAVIGAGSMAREHIKAFQALPNVKVKALHSRTRARADKLAAEFSIPMIADSVTELYEKSHADLVVVTVPELEARKVAKECFQHDWAVMLEKPAGYDLVDALGIAEAAKEHTKPVLVAFNRRAYSSSRSVLEDINLRSHEKRFIHIQDQQSFAEARRYNQPEEVVKKFMYANSIHNIDLLRYFGRGEVTKVERIVPWQGEKSALVLIYLEFSSGDQGLYEGLWQGPGPWGCSVSLPSRRWVMRPVETATYQNLNERRVVPIEIDKVDKNYKPGFYKQAQAVCKAVRGESNCAVTIEESLKTMKLIHQMFQV